MKKLILLLSLTLILISCKSDDDNFQNIELHTETLSIIPYQLVKISSYMIDFSQEDYLADFGINQVPLTKNNEGDLIFLTPDVPPGYYELELTIEDRKGFLNFYVGNNNPDIETTVFNRAIEPLQFFQEFATSLILQNEFSQQTIDRVNSSNAMISDLMQAYHSVSTSEKEKIAKFLNANNIFSETFGQHQSSANNRSGENLDFLVNAIRLMGLTDKFNSWNQLLIPTIVQSETAAIDDIIKVFTVVGFYSLSTHIEVSIEAIRDINLIPVTVSIFDENNNSNQFVFQNNTSKSFALKVGERRLTINDINPSGTFLSKIVTQIEYIQSRWDDFKIINPTVTHSANWFSEWLLAGSNYVAVSPDIAPLRQSDNIVYKDGNSEYLAIEGIPNGINHQFHITGGNTFDLTFNAEQNTLPQTFDIKIKYDIDVFETIIENITISLE